MRSLGLRAVSFAALLALVSFVGHARADDKDNADANNKGLSVTVAFGSGLNTVPAVGLSGPPNHHILPPQIFVKQGGVVHLLMSGFHMAVVYKPGITPQDIVIPPTGTFINDPTKPPPANVFYFGINPQGGPLATPPTTNPLNGSNRTESVSFSDPGTYLLICNVAQHFRDGMFAFINVLPQDADIDEVSQQQSQDQSHMGMSGMQ